MNIRIFDNLACAKASPFLDNSYFIYPDKGWNDYGYYSTFFLSKREKSGECTTIGELRLLTAEINQAKLYNNITKFKDLDELKKPFASVGINSKFYENLKNENNYNNILAQLNDVVYSPSNLVNLVKEIIKSDIKDPFFGQYNPNNDKKRFQYFIDQSFLRDESGLILCINYLKSMKAILEKGTIDSLNTHIETQKGDFQNYNIEIENLIYEIYKEKDFINSETYTSDYRNALVIALNWISNYYSEPAELLNRVSIIGSHLYKENFKNRKRLAELIQKLEKDLRVTNITKDLCQYTAVSTITKVIVLPEDKDKKHGKLRLTNVRQFNDPSEGTVLYKLLTQNHSNSFNQSYYYVSSATTKVDNLSLWRTYAQDGKGVCLVYNEKYIQDLIKRPQGDPTKLGIYRICYVKFEDDCDDFQLYIPGFDNQTCKNVESDLKELINECKCSSPSSTSNNTDSVNSGQLGLIKYLFKDYSYKDEEEYRIIVQENDSKKISLENCADHKVPFLYKYLDKESSNINPKFQE